MHAPPPSRCAQVKHYSGFTGLAVLRCGREDQKLVGSCVRVREGMGVHAHAHRRLAHACTHALPSTRPHSPPPPPLRSGARCALAAVVHPAPLALADRAARLGWGPRTRRHMHCMSARTLAHRQNTHALTHTRPHTLAQTHTRARACRQRAVCGARGGRRARRRGGSCREAAFCTRGVAHGRARAPGHARPLALARQPPIATAASGTDVKA
jgi:hypothetical protein